MISDGELIALFNSPTRAMQAEKVLRLAGFACRLIPAPREVAEGCALALRFAYADQGSIFRELAARDLLPRRLYGKEQGALTPLELPTNH
jgi:hypothetical protein